MGRYGESVFGSFKFFFYLLRRGEWLSWGKGRLGLEGVLEFFVGLDLVGLSVGEVDWFLGVREVGVEVLGVFCLF